MEQTVQLMDLESTLKEALSSAGEKHVLVTRTGDSYTIRRSDHTINVKQSETRTHFSVQFDHPDIELFRIITRMGQYHKSGPRITALGSTKKLNFSIPAPEGSVGDTLYALLMASKPEHYQN